MDVRFYSITDNNNVINKSIGSPTVSISANVYNDCSVLAPTIIVDYKPAIVTSNYFEIPLWNRFYYITNDIVISGGRCIITGKVDVLKSNESQILEMDAYRVRSEKAKTNMAVDTSYPSLITANVTTKNFKGSPFGANSNNYVLTVKGGK